MTGVTLEGKHGRTWRSQGAYARGDAWEPHTGAIGLGNDYLETAGEASLFRTMVHEIGHVLGAWQGGAWIERYAHYTDFESGTWTGPEVVAIYGGPAPFQDSDDAHGWHDGERRAEASNFDFGHSGVCSSVMAYCAHGAAIPAFLPAEIDFAFLADLGLTIDGGYGPAGDLRTCRLDGSFRRSRCRFHGNSTCRLLILNRAIS